MLDATTLLTFVAASLAIVLTPGPAQALVLARTLSDGRRAGMMTAVGLNLGTLVHALAAGLGASAVLATSALAFDGVKYAGAAYLVYLGARAWHDGAAAEAPAGAPSQRALGRAVVTGLLNPKVALFFLAYLPQFVDPSRGAVLTQCVVLGTVLALIDIAYEGVLVWLTGSFGTAMRGGRFRQWQHRFSGAVLVGLGARLALAERR